VTVKVAVEMVMAGSERCRVDGRWKLPKLRRAGREQHLAELR